jgi:hypothetical protein
MRQLIVGLSLLASTTALAAPPAVTTAGDSYSGGQQTCLVKASAAMTKAGFSDGLGTAGQTVYGTKGNYSASIRCFQSPDFVVFIVAGPSGSQSTTDKHNGALFDAFKN